MHVSKSEIELSKNIFYTSDFERHCNSLKFKV